MTTLDAVTRANSEWFAPGNKAFFNDLDYQVERSKSGDLYLLRSTYGWSDMFGGRRVKTFRLNLIDSKTLKIGKLTDDIFKSEADALDWLDEN